MRSRSPGFFVAIAKEAEDTAETWIIYRGVAEFYVSRCSDADGHVEGFFSGFSEAFEHGAAACDDDTA